MCCSGGEPKDEALQPQHSGSNDSGSDESSSDESSSEDSEIPRPAVSSGTATPCRMKALTRRFRPTGLASVIWWTLACLLHRKGNTSKHFVFSFAGQILDNTSQRGWLTAVLRELYQTTGVNCPETTRLLVRIVHLSETLVWSWC